MALTKANEGVVSLTSPTIAGTTTLTGPLITQASSSSTYPLRLSGTAVLTTPVAGTLEYDGSALWLTNSSAARKSFLYADGSNAPGTGTTYSISIGGNSATTTNGVVTTGTYSDPSWITSLDAGKITTGTMSGARISGNMSVGTIACTTLTGGPIYTTSSLYQGTSCYLYPGSVSGYTANQTSIYLASYSATASVYTNGSFHAAGSVYAAGDVYAAYSDDRLKIKKGNIHHALDIVKSLNGFRYTNSETANNYGYTDTKVHLGVSAQEVEAVLPEIVNLAPFDIGENPETSKTGNNYKTVNYEKLVPVLIEAIKELSAQVDHLRYGHS